jgi:hypothetical protein
MMKENRKAEEMANGKAGSSKVTHLRPTKGGLFELP